MEAIQRSPRYDTRPRGVFNFGAGPGMLPPEVVTRVRDELPGWRDTGMSVMEMSHRSRHFTEIARQAEADLRELLAIPASHRVLFLQGGATGQFAAVPLNLAHGGRADYVDSGHWAARAIDEARRFCTVGIAAGVSAGVSTAVPPVSEWRLDPAAAYVHYTDNETIDGIEFAAVPDTAGVPLVADMSSNLLSRPVDVARFGVIYAGAQKNIGPAGLTVVIVRQDLLRPAPAAPAILDWHRQAAGGSMLNTPPTFAWYVAGLVFQWLKENGGPASMDIRNRRKADLLYAAIDGSGGFYRNAVAPQWRSRMNVPFQLPSPGLETAFLAEAGQAGLLELNGHRSVGGIRASLYNAMGEEGVRALTAFMADFQQRNG